MRNRFYGYFGCNYRKAQENSPRNMGTKPNHLRPLRGGDDYCCYLPCSGICNGDISLFLNCGSFHIFTGFVVVYALTLWYKEDPLLTQNGIGRGSSLRIQRKIRPANSGKQHKTEPKRFRFSLEITYGPEGWGRIPHSVPKILEILRFRGFLFCISYLFPPDPISKWYFTIPRSNFV